MEDSAEEEATGAISGLRGVFGFLTVIPVGHGKLGLANTARYMFFFPISGLVIGLIAGGCDWVFLHFFPSLLAAIVAFGILLFLTGLHDFDGLLDFGDGLMCKGSPERKIQAMRDTSTGAGALFLGVITIIITSLAFSYIPPDQIIFAFATAELLGKFSMTLLAKTSKSASPGTNTYFVSAMNGTAGDLRLAISAAITLVLAIALGGVRGLILFVFAVLATMLISLISSRHFNGITGDVFGANSELVRMISILVLVALVR